MDGGGVIRIFPEAQSMRSAVSGLAAREGPQVSCAHLEMQVSSERLFERIVQRQAQSQTMGGHCL